MASKTARRHEWGTMGLAAAVEVSHSKVVLVPGRGTSVSTSPIMAVRYAWTSASACCDCAILRRLKLGSPAAMQYRMGAKFHAGEGICHYIVLAMNMMHVRGVFGYEGEVVLLPRHPAF